MLSWLEVFSTRHLGESDAAAIGELSVEVARYVQP